MDKKLAQKKLLESAMRYYQAWVRAAKTENEKDYQKAEAAQEDFLVAAETYEHLVDGIGQPINALDC